MTAGPGVNWQDLAREWGLSVIAVLEPMVMIILVCAHGLAVLTTTSILVKDEM